MTATLIASLTSTAFITPTAITGGTGIYEEVFVRNVVPRALGEDYRYQIKWDPSANTNGAYRIYITTADGVKHLVGTAWNNTTNA